MREIVPRRKWRYPMAYERSYAKMLAAYVKRKMDVVNVFLPDMVAAVQSSGQADNIGMVADLIKVSVEDAEKLRPIMHRMYGQVERYNKAEFDAITRSVFGLPLSNVDMSGQLHFDAEIGSQDLERLWVDQNLDLIKSIDADTLSRIKRAMNQAIVDNVDTGELTEYLVEKLKDIANIEHNRAVLIGTDQVGKLNGRISQYQQQRAGLTSYIWETAHDSRVRDSHQARQGRRYYWSNPPADGHPGQPIRCRCVALPVIDIDKVPIRTKRGTFVYVASLAESIAKKAEAAAANKPDFEQTTTKLRATMPDDDYQEFKRLAERNDDIKRLYSNADRIDGIYRIRGRGRYRNGWIEYNFNSQDLIEDGANKYDVLAHEYGHFFDAKLSYKGLTYQEVKALNSVLKVAKLDLVASSSDKFLGAIRKDIGRVKELYEADKSMIRMFDDGTSHGIQDSIDGLFPEAKTWYGHSEKYWNRRFNGAYAFGNYSRIKDAYQAMGFTANNRDAVKRIYRQYEAASEIWANITSAATVNDGALKWFQEYMPETYKAYTEIIKELT